MRGYQIGNFVHEMQWKVGGIACLERFEAMDDVPETWFDLHLTDENLEMIERAIQHLLGLIGFSEARATECLNSLHELLRAGQPAVSVEDNGRRKVAIYFNATPEVLVVVTGPNHCWTLAAVGGGMLAEKYADGFGLYFEDERGFLLHFLEPHPHAASVINPSVAIQTAGEPRPTPAEG